MDFLKLLERAAEHGASDIHLQGGCVPMLRVAGAVVPEPGPPLNDAELRQWIRKIAPPDTHSNLDEVLAEGLDFSHTVAGVGRFRCSGYRQMGRAGLSMRAIPDVVPTPADLNLPGVVRDIALVRRGLTLVAGTSGSGRSATLAALIGMINTNQRVKIVTIEDPVEYVHMPEKAMIAQLEVGPDTPSLQQGLRQALRQGPDVVFVSELRDTETLRIALHAADAGLQVLAAVHSSDAPQTIERMMTLFRAGEHNLMLSQLAGALEAVVAQRLVTVSDGRRRPALEILRGNSITARYILEGRLPELRDYMQIGESGMQTFDQHLLELYNQGLIRGTEALRWATYPEALSLRMLGD